MNLMTNRRLVVFLGLRREARAKKPKTSWIRRLLLALSVLSFVIGIGLIGLEFFKSHRVVEVSRQNQIGNLTREQIKVNAEKEVSYDFSVIRTMNAYDVIKSSINPDELPTVGGIAIPELQMNLPIYKGVSEEGMFYGAGTLLPNQKMGEGNYSLASHHSITKGALFEPLLRAQVGQLIYLTDLERVYVYKTTDVFEVTPDRIDVLNDVGRSVITLITCDTSLTNRIIVRGELQESVAIEHATQAMIDAFQLDQVKHLNGEQ